MNATPSDSGSLLAAFTVLHSAHHLTQSHQFYFCLLLPPLEHEPHWAGTLVCFIQLHDLLKCTL